MNKELLNKYFNDQCTADELEEVLAWFQTKEGAEYLRQDFDEQEPLLSQSSDLLFRTELNSNKLFNRIQHNKKGNNSRKSNYGVYLRVASILLIAGLFSYAAYLMGGINLTGSGQDKSEVLVTYVTKEDQQKVFTLTDGTKIRLNEKSSLTVPETWSKVDRVVKLEGEGYFEVVKNQPQKFIVEVNGASVVVLGTKFNVKSDAPANNVQVAVVEGKVALQSREGEQSVSVQLAKDDFGLLQLSTNRITIEKTRAVNHLSWMSNRLTYSGETLNQVSQQLEHLFGADIDFGSERLKRLELTANFEKSDLETTISTIAKTFDIRYEIEGQKVIWKE